MADTVPVSTADSTAAPGGSPTLTSGVGPVEFGILGGMVALRSILMRADAMWEPGSRRWLVER
jgi:hypothetical protein